MNLEKKKKLLEEITRDLLEKVGFSKPIIYIANPASSSDTENDDNSLLSIEIQHRESKYLIGKHGANLNALQHILRTLIRKKAGEEKISFNVDVNNYRQEQNKTVSELARESAKKVLETGEAIYLKPMNAFERRLVHMELSENKSVQTESLGEGDDRRIVIKPSGNEQFFSQEN